VYSSGLIREANGEGQLYALLGLHLLAPDIFQAEAEKLRTNDGPPERIENFTPIGKGKVRVAHGCIFFQQDRPNSYRTNCERRLGRWHFDVLGNFIAAYFMKQVFAVFPDRDSIACWLDYQAKIASSQNGQLASPRKSIFAISNN
jgi:hypothetical protein